MSEDIRRKLTSRKFWATVCEFVSMLVVAFGGTQDTATKVAALIMAGASVIAYIIGEGMIDAANAKAPVIHLPEEVFMGEEKPPEEDGEANG